MIHPLQTDAVTYVIQRTELLMGFFYLLTLYCAVRGWGSSSPGRWFATAVGACALGMGCKEVMVSAPLAVLLYDRVFRSDSLAEAWRRSRVLYLGLATSWIIMAVVLVSGPRSGTVGFSHGASSLSYLQTQAGVIVWYLRLCFWPDPLVIDYAWPLAVAPADWILPGTGVLVLLVLTLWGLIRRSWWGFLGAWFFLILAPTSSFIPLVTEPAAERRMYLPLAAVVVLVVVGGWWAWQKLCAPMSRQGRLVPWGAVGLAVVVATLLGYGTAERNGDYRSALAIWQDTVTKRPHHVAARLKLANLRFEAGQLDEAARNYQRVLEARPQSAETHFNLANAQAAQGRFDDAIEHYNEALRLNPRYAEAHNNLGRLLAVRGRYDPALGHLTEALEVNPDYLAARINVAGVLAKMGKLDEAVGHFIEALRRDTTSIDARMGLADALLDQGRFDRAEAEYRRVLEFNPRQAGAHANLAIALAMRGATAQAIAELQEALRLDPSQPGARRLLADLLAGSDGPGGD